MNTLLSLVKRLLIHLGVGAHFADELETLLQIGIVLLATFLLWSFLQVILLFIKKSLLSRLKLSQKGKFYIINTLKKIIAIIVLTSLFQVASDIFKDGGKILSGSLKIIIIAIIIFSIGVLNCLLQIGYDIISKKSKYKQRPIKGIMQILQITFYFIGCILVVAVLIDKSPIGLLTGLGAFAAILSFIFKDTILGFVAGIQLSYNDMVRPGDWIVVNNSLANGVVIDISLITVKVQNFDNTIINVPTYSLINTPFQNWRGMDESGGRRINLNFNIDVKSVHFCSEQEFEAYSAYVQIPQRFANGQDKKQITNLELYRMYLLKMILKNPQVNKDLMLMVRYLQPGPLGIPIQIYCFSKNKGWVTYEAIQAAILEQAVASAGIFKISLFQTLYSTKEI